MKKLIATLLLVLPFMAAQATVHIIQVGSNFYSPNNLTIAVGDTARFQWAGGSHPTVSVNGAWPAFSVSSGNTVNDIVLNQPGNYSYYCSYHGGMSGFIQVAVLAAPKNEQEALAISISPNPATEQIVVNYTHLQVDLLSVTNAIGAEKRSVRAISGIPLTLNIADLPAGVYFVSLQSKGQRIATKRLVKDR
jgi:plastocyanin